MATEMVKDEQQKILDELTRHVTVHFEEQVIQARVAQTLELLLQSMRKDVAQAVREAIMMSRGTVAKKRDEEWSRVICAIWLQDPEAVVPTDPYDVQAWVLAKQQRREQELARSKIQDGYQQGWKDALLKGVKFGWAGFSAGKGLEEVLQAAPGSVK